MGKQLFDILLEEDAKKGLKARVFGIEETDNDKPDIYGIDFNKNTQLSVSLFFKAYRAALQHSRKGGFLAPMPVLAKRIESYFIFYANSEEACGIDKHGKFYNKGERVVITIHGGLEGRGILTPDVIEKAFRSMLNCQIKDCLPFWHAIPFEKAFPNKDIITDLLNCRLPNGSSLPVYSYEEFLEQGSHGIFNRYAVVRSFKQAKKTKPGLIEVEKCYDDSQVIVHSGGLKEAKIILDNWKEYHSKFPKKMSISNRFNYEHFDPEISHGYFLVHGHNCYFDATHHRFIGYYGVFASVSKEDLDKFQNI